MAVTAFPAPGSSAKPSATDIVANGIRRRYAAERRFRLYGILAVLFGLTFLVILFTNIIARGYTSFLQSSFRLDVALDPAAIDPSGTREENALLMADYGALATRALWSRPSRSIPTLAPTSAPLRGCCRRTPIPRSATMS